jgi:hypothetical protein
MRYGIGQLILLDDGVCQSQFGGGGFGIQIDGGAELLLGLRGIAGIEQRFGQIQARPEFLGLLVRGLLQVGRGAGGLLVANQQNAGVQFGFV